MEKTIVGKNSLMVITVKEAFELYQKNAWVLNLFANEQDIQRNKVWKKSNSSNFIDTILRFCESLSVLVVVEKDGQFQTADGKQRFTSLIRFLNNEYKLGKLPLVNGESVSGKSFSELSEELQERILNATLWVKVFPYESDQQVAELFVKLNEGEKLRSMEKMRADLTGEIPFIQEVVESEFFIQDLKYSNSQRNRFADGDLAVGLIMEEMQPGCDQNKSKREQFAKDLNKKLQLTKKGQQEIIKKLAYLHQVFSPMFLSKEEEKEARKLILSNSNRVLLYKMVQECINEKYNADHVYSFLKDYFINKRNSYFIVAGSTSTSNKSSLDIRYKHIKSEMRKYMKKISLIATKRAMRA